MHSTNKRSSLTRTSGAAAGLLCLCAVLSSGCSGGSNSSSPPPPTKTTYTGTVYMASEAGGHVAIVPITIDPSNATTPIVVDVANETRVQLRNADGTLAGTGIPPTGTNTNHIFHDLRLDGTKLYYSTIFTDAANNNAHLGYVDLANGNAVHDAMIDATPAAQAGMVYCGSGQSATHYFPMTMSSPAYIDAIDKSAIVTGATLAAGSASVTRTMVNTFRAGGDPNYLFAHGVNNPGSTKLYVVVNETDPTTGAMTGAITSYLMNTSDVVAGTVTSANVTSHTVSGLTPAMGTIAFRPTYTPDGTKILQAGSDRFMVLNASDLSVLDNNTAIGGSFKAFTGNGGVQNHDVMATPDGKYAILSLRFQHASGDMEDSGLQLYDLANKRAIGDPVSTCSKCHDSTTIAHPTCGLVGNLTAVTQ
ncbi:MAG TPA: hypothetical protein VF841_07585 [Anaeromyxobacter sp.]